MYKPALIAHRIDRDAHLARTDRVVVVGYFASNRIVGRNICALITEHLGERRVVEQLLRQDQPVAQHGDVMVGVVRQVTVVDAGHRFRIGRHHIDTAAALRRHTSDLDERSSVGEDGLGGSTHREQVQIKDPIDSPRREGLAKGLLFGAGTTGRCFF